ncbi:trypsin-like serine protease [Streptomyces sp. NPDC007088]|uniref:trypsin-like serine protease n=1 Tax=Streptomyces sp. NPDC007088 TaxID=3364773 RepID=UPI0036ABE00C
MRQTRPVRSAALAATLIAGAALLAAPPAAAVTGPAVAPAETTHAYTARITIGDHDRGCSGVLVDQQWLLTAASCFAGDPAASLTVPAGKPRQKTTAIIGRSDLTGSAGSAREVVALVPRGDRDVVLARLNRPVTNVPPIPLATAAPVPGEELTLAGYGRTATDWAPMSLHTGAFQVAASTATTTAITGQDGVAACAGDAGGPLVRTAGGSRQLAALSSQSYGGGCFGTDDTQTSTGGIAARVDDLSVWMDATVGAVPLTDYNCDGTEDIAIADPRATVAGDTDAGLIRIVHGAGKGTAEITQDLGWIPGGAEPGDRFGESLATVDYNEDGCTDLVAGSPGETLGGQAQAGFVQILYGAPGGLGTGTLKAAHLEQGMGSGDVGTSVPEAGDRMGASLAAGTTASGEPYLVVGAPGEGVGAHTRAGIFYYLRGTTNTSVHQGSTGVPGAVEDNDAFGASLSADAHRIAVGAPGEAIGAGTNAGAVVVLDHTLNAEGHPTARFALDQDLDTVSGGAEAGDRFGESLALVTYRPMGAATANESILTVGSPGEDITVSGTGRADAGMAQSFRVGPTGHSQLTTFLSGTADDDISDTSEAGDRFGTTLSAVNTAPHAVGTTATMRLAIGIPDEDIGTTANAGAVLSLSLLGEPGADDQWVQAGGTAGIPGPPGANQRLGSSLHLTGRHLYAGMPTGPSPYGSLHALPLSNVTPGGTAAPITTYQPGQGNLPPTGTRFGHTAR